MKISLKAALTAAALTLAAGSSTMLFADDQEVKKTEDTSKNPVTGTETNTKKEETKKTNADGSVTKTKKSKVTKHKKDGSTTQKTETENETEQK